MKILLSQEKRIAKQQRREDLEEWAKWIEEVQSLFDEDWEFQPCFEQKLKEIKKEMEELT